MGMLFVYDPWPAAVDTLGLCGPLLATSAKFTGEAGANLEIVIQHPIDEYGKWAHLVNGNLIKAPVPMRTTPEYNRSDGAFVSTLRRMTVKADATLAQRSVYTRETNGIRLAILDPGTTVYCNTTFVTLRSRIRWADGWGYIDPAALDAAYADVSLGGADMIEYYIPPPRSRMQLFRIYAVRQTDSGVTVNARHVSYDQIGNITSIAGGYITAGVAVGGITTGLVDGRVDTYAPVEFAAGQVTDQRDVAAWTRVSPVEALLAPSGGIAAMWKRDVLRDNWSFSAIPNAGTTRHFEISYGVNMLGIDYTEDDSEAVSVLIPVGQTSKGKPLVVPAGSYVVDGSTVDVLSGGRVVSPYGDPYPTPHISVLDLGSEIKAASATSGARAAAYVKLIRAAINKFTYERCDLPAVSAKVDFIRLGDTAEYPQYRELQKMYLYDSVRIRHSRLGLDLSAKVNKVVWDCLTERYDSIEIGSVRRNYARSKLAPWMVPGLASLQSYVDTISDLV